MARSRKSHNWIKRKGKLGGAGFLSKKKLTQKRILGRCVKKYGYRSCLGSVLVLSRNRSINKRYSRKIKALTKYMKSLKKK